MAASITREQALFDEAGYMRLYPDVRESLAAGGKFTAWIHYRDHGRPEGRKANDVDPAFYLAAYPQAVEDIAAGRATGAASHYILLGRGRSYRPCAAAPSLTAGQGAGLWTDLPHAADLVEGQQQLGRLTPRQAGLLQRWIRDGFILLDAVIDPVIAAAAALDLERGFSGGCPDLRFSCAAVELGAMQWQPEINPYPAAALDLHYLSRPVRRLLFAEQITEVLALLFDSPALLTHSRAGLRDSTPALHRDTLSAAFSLPRQFVTVWVGLDEADPADPIEYYPGTHLLSPVEQRTYMTPGVPLGVDPVVLPGGRGRVAFRHPELMHRAAAVPSGRTRRGILAQYCPRFVAPRYMESVRTQVWPHGPHGFAAQYYPALDPLD